MTDRGTIGRREQDQRVYAAAAGLARALRLLVGLRRVRGPARRNADEALAAWRDVKGPS